MPDIVLAARRTNERLSVESANHILTATARLSGFPSDPVVSLLGIAFKGRPATDDLRGTTAKPILDALKVVFPRGHYRGWDAVVPASEIDAFGLEPVSSLANAIKGANLVVIANNHLAFAEMPIETLAEAMAKPGLVYDYWNNFNTNSLNLPAHVRYMSLGGAGLVQE